MAVKIYKKTDKTNISTNFNASEFACRGSGCCASVLIDEKLVKYLQQIRDHFGKPVTINSGYRCAVHNKRVGGSTASKHTTGHAADISVKDTAPAEVAKYAESLGILGIGLYETEKDGYFVHIDTRTYKSFWYGQAQEYRSTFGGSEKTCTVTLPVLYTGAKGESVKALQQLLIANGYSCGKSGADGEFGDITEGAVVDFQADRDLTVDGACGPETWTALLGTN